MYPWYVSPIAGRDTYRRYMSLKRSSVRRDFGGDDLAGIARRLALGQRIDGFHARDHLAPDGILTVEEVGVVQADEELAVGGVGPVGAGHRDGAAGVRLGVELGLEVGLLGAAHAG